MCIYCGTKKYRKIYENHMGPIPKDENGRTYEIHHIDGNHSNNSPENLSCVTLQEHYDIHYAQEDWGACYLMGGKLKVSPEMLSDLLKKQSAVRIANGTHNFLNTELKRKWAIERVANGTHPWVGDGSFQRTVQRRSIEAGTHHLLSGRIQKAHAKKNAQKLIENGTSRFLDKDWQKQNAQKLIAAGTHPSHQLWTCEDCGMRGKGLSQLSRHTNGNNCKS